MTSVRTSMVFSLEDTFGGGIGSTYAWIAPSPGSYFDHTESRNTTRIQSAGSKTWDTVAYGKLEGTWNWNFVLDYNYLEFLYLIFEGATPGAGTATTIDGVTTYSYSFSKVNNKRIPSFCVRRVILNVMAGGLRSSSGGLDEIVYLKGCIVESVTFSRAANQSQMTVNMNGYYADSEMQKGTLTGTDYQPYAGNLMEYTCMFVDSDGNAQDNINESDYVANTETLSLTISNSAEMFNNVCTPIAKEYVEGLSKYTFSTTAYANDPSHYQQRMYSGGYNNTVLKPMVKGLKPIPKLLVLGYNKEIGGAITTHAQAYDASPQRMKIRILECVIRSLQWRSGDSEKLMDNISSTECKQITMDFLSPSADYSFTANDTNAIPANKMAIFEE